jgi:hypothetical protein
VRVKVAFVVPRDGPTIRGGAETGARMRAERLVSDKGYDVEVLTAYALDAIAGRDEHFHPLWAQLRDDHVHAGVDCSFLERFAGGGAVGMPDPVGGQAGGNGVP